MVSPSKKTVADKIFEAKLKRHVIRGKAEKLTENINIYQKQNLKKQEYMNQYSPHKIS
jgi:hypothetical protein